MAFRELSDAEWHALEAENGTDLSDSENTENIWLESLQQNKAENTLARYTNWLLPPRRGPESEQAPHTLSGLLTKPGGMKVQLHKGMGIRIVQVDSQCGGEKLGLQPGWLIVRVEGLECGGVGFESAMAQLRAAEPCTIEVRKDEIAAL